MANLFSTIKDNPASEKFFLIRITPARRITDDLTLDSGTTYSMTFPFLSIEKLVVDGTDYTLVSGAPSSAEYSFDESTMLLTINFGTALTTQQVISFYNLFYTTNTTGFKQAPQDPLDVTTTFRSWESRVSRDPNIKFDQRDILGGVLSFGASSISINNQDHIFEQYLTDDDSFANKVVVIWQCLDSVDNCQIAFKGNVKNLTVGDVVSITFFDFLSSLSKTLYSNGNFINSTYNSTRFPNVNPIQANRPIRKVMGKVTTYKEIDESVSGKFQLEQRALLEAVNVDYDTNFSVTTNRNWGLTLAETTVADHQQTDTVVSVDNTDPNFTRLTVGSTKEYLVGDSLSVAVEEVFVVDTDLDNDKIDVTKNLTVAATETITRRAFTIIIEQNDVFYYPDTNHFAETIGTNNILQVEFIDNFEAALGMTPLNPDSDIVRFRAYGKVSRDTNHGSVLEELLEDLDFTVDSASIATANATTLNTNFYIPFIGDDSFQTNKTVIEKLLVSTFGMLSLNTDLELVYKLFEAPTSTDETTDREIILNSFNIDIDYNDVVDSITAKNDHIILLHDSTSSEFESTKARFLHEITSTKEINHILESPDRLQSILNVLAERSANYEFTTKTHNATNILADDIELVRDNLLGSDSERDVKILSLSKNADRIRIVANDLLGL